MIQDIEPRLDNRFADLPSRPEDLALCFREDTVLASLQGGEIRFPTVGECGAAGRYLFSVGKRRYFLCEAEPFGAYAYEPIGALRQYPPREQAFAGVTALHLYRWYRNNRYCGRCGAPMRHSQTERAMVCGCGNTVYPAIAPAVIVGVVNGDKICLTKYNRGYAHWALVAGYTEIGGTPGQSAAREVMGVSGPRASSLCTYKCHVSGPSGRPLLGYFCEAAGDDTIRVDHDELKEGRWFTAEEIDFPDDRFSLTREMIARFREGAWRESPVG